MHSAYTVIANWKMNPKTKKEAHGLIASFKKSAPRTSSLVSVVFAPPALYLQSLREKFRSLSFCAQTVSYDEKHAHTGSLSAGMFFDEGARYAIIGHSEVRKEGVTDEKVGQMLAEALKAGLTPVLCIGEMERDHNGFFLHEVKTELEEALALVPKTALEKILITYEPVWAISSNKGREATPEEFREMAIFIRKVCADIGGAKVAATIPILYGGSVDEKTAEMFLAAGARGLLVGHASLDAKKFAAIVATAETFAKKK